MAGQYRGFYKYSHERIQKAVKHEKTFFTLNINDVNGGNFAGTVSDDADTGGTPGEGTVTGRISGNEISFVKQMPVLTFHKGERRMTFNKKHPKIYYHGRLENGKYTGTWKIKFNIKFIGILPVIGMKTTGIWEMEGIGK